MPWDAAGMHAHNSALHGATATHAATIANAVLRRSGDEGMALAVANRDAKLHRDDGGMVPAAPQPTPGLQPSNATASPLIGQYMQRFQQMSLEQLQELLPRLSGQPQLAQIAQHVLQQKRLTPTPQAAPQPQQAMPQAGIPAQQARGGQIRMPMPMLPHRASGGTSPATAAPYSNSMTPGQYQPLTGVPGAFVGLVPSTQGPAPPGFNTAPTPPPTGGVTPLPGGTTSTPNLMQPGQTWGSYLQGLFPQKGVTPTPAASTTPTTTTATADPALPYGPNFTATGAPINTPAGGQARGGALTFAKGGSYDGNVPILAAGGEFVISPHHVAKLGKGDIKAGHKLLDDFVVTKRKEIVERMKGLKGPVKT